MPGQASQTTQPTGAGRLLGIDLGTSSVKVVLGDPSGTAHTSATAAYDVVSPHPGWAETEPARWLDAVTRAVQVVMQRSGTRAPDVLGIGLSGQMHGLVLTGARGEPTRAAMLHPDTRAAAYLAVYRDLPDDVLARLANPLSPNMAGPMLLWAASHDPDAYRGARWALQPKDWLRLRLTGRAAAEPSDASATLLYDLPGDRWDFECADLLGVDGALLAPLLPSATSVAGELTAEAAELLGLAPGTPVAAGGGDTAVAAVGSGLLTPGDVQVTVGTGGQVVTPLSSPVAHPERGTHVYRSATPHGWYAMGAILNAGLALDWVRRMLRVDWAELYEAAASPGRPDDPVFLPHLSGERTPYLDPAMRGAWTGLGLGTDRTTMLRAALEGVAFALRDALDALPNSGADVTSPVRLAGGGTRSLAWRRLLADVLGRPLQSLDLHDVSARGAALLGGVAAKLVEPADLGGPLAPALGELTEPDPDGVAAQAARRERFLTAVASLSPSAPRDQGVFGSA